MSIRRIDAYPGAWLHTALADLWEAAGRPELVPGVGAGRDQATAIRLWNQLGRNPDRVSNPYTGPRTHLRGTSFDLRYPERDRASCLRVGLRLDRVAGERWHVELPNATSYPIATGAQLASLDSVPITEQDWLMTLSQKQQNDIAAVAAKLLEPVPGTGYTKLDVLISTGYEMRKFTTDLMTKPFRANVIDVIISRIKAGAGTKAGPSA